MLVKLDDLLTLDLTERMMNGSLSAALSKVLLERLLGEKGESAIPEKVKAKVKNDADNIVKINDMDGYDDMVRRG